MNATPTNNTQPNIVTEAASKKSKGIGLWFDKKLHKSVRARAAALGLSMSAYFRMLASHDIKKSKIKKAKLGRA